MSFGLCQLLRRCRRRAAEMFLHENWMIGWINEPIENSLNWTVCPPVHWIGPRSSARYLADPFPWPGAPGVVLCEKYDFGTHLGSIIRLETGGAEIKSETPVAFPLSGHLSFPFLFQSGGSIYCMPESSAARTLKIFRWQNPSWEEIATPLPSIAAADAVLFEHGGYFWIAYTDIDISPFNNLNLCYAETLSGPWRKHEKNPVKIDIRSARCGGTPFRIKEKLYRPAQDCQKRYGAAIRIMEITECSPEAFHEKEITRIAPEPGINPHGFHTLSAWGDKCLADGKRMIFSPRRVMEKAWRKIMRLD